MSSVKSLVETCIDTVARYMPYEVNFTCAAVPVSDLVQRMYNAYMRYAQARRLSGSGFAPAAHVAALRQFATCWSPSVLALRLPAIPPQALDELACFAHSLVHLELSCAASSSLVGLAALSSLTCLSLRGCQQLQQAALQQLLPQLPQLLSLDLSGLAAVTDSLAPTLASLPQLLVLQISRTSCSDATIEWLTYGHRLHEWQQQQQVLHRQQQQQQAGGYVTAAAQPPGAHASHTASTAEVNAAWPRTKIRQWHLAHTHVTARAAELLLCCPDVVFLDMRGSGVKAFQLIPLRTKFALHAVQGAVLSRSAAMAAVAVSYDMFACVKASEHAAAAAQVQDREHASLQQWVHEGVAALLHAKAILVDSEAAAAAATEASLQFPPIAWAQPPCVPVAGWQAAGVAVAPSQQQSLAPVRGFLGPYPLCNYH